MPGEFRTGDIRHCLADTTRARELLGYEAETELADGLPELAEWVAGQTVTERGDEAVARCGRATWWVEGAATLPGEGALGARTSLERLTLSGILRT